MDLRSKHIIAWVIWIFLSLVWGSSFILIKKALIGLSPTELAVIRIFVAFVAFLPFIALRWRRVGKRDWKYLALIGIFGNGLPAILYATAQTRVLSGSAGILNALTPIFTLLLSVVLFRQRFKGAQTYGVIMGFVGAGLLFAQGWDLSTLNRYTLLIVLATLCYGMSVNLVAHKVHHIPPLTIAACSFVVIGPLSIVGVANMDPGIWTEASLSIFYTAVLALFSTFLASILFYQLVQLTDPIFSSSVSYFAPFVAFLWGLIDHEALGIKHILALILILWGVYLIRSARTRTSS